MSARRTPSARPKRQFWQAPPNGNSICIKFNTVLKIACNQETAYPVGMRQDLSPLDQKRQRLAAIGREQLIDLVAELWISVEALIDNAQKPRGPKSADASAKNSGVKLTKTWKEIIQRLSTYKHFRAADVILVSQALHKEGTISRTQTPGGARAQLCLLTKRGVIKRRGGGNYQVIPNAKCASDRPKR